MEGKIEGIFFSEFHPTKGPKIVVQVPEDTPNQISLDDLHMYLIPKTFYRKIIKLNYSGQIIMGYPISLKGEEYERNELRFNCCFLFNSSTDTSNYENIVRKLNLYLEQEVIHGSLFSNFAKNSLSNLLISVHRDLNSTGKCHYVGENNSSLHLQINVKAFSKVTIKNTDVPIFTGISLDRLTTSQCDIVGKKILPLINGEKPVNRIAIEGEVEKEAVKEYLKTFVYHGAISIVSLFQYSNVYMLTPRIRLLYLDTDMQDRCLSFVSLPGKTANFTDVFKFFSCLSSSRVDELCVRLNPRARGFDERRLIQWGLMEGLVRKVDKYPIKEDFHYNGGSTVPGGTNQGVKKILDSYLTGHLNYDDICDLTGLSHSELDEKLEAEGVTVCWK